MSQNFNDYNRGAKAPQPAQGNPSASANLRSNAEAAMESIKDAASTAADTAKSTFDGMKDAAGTVAGSAKSTLTGMASDAAKAFTDAVAEQKTAGAGAIADVARSARESADGFKDQAPQVANAVRSVAGSIERASNDIKDRSVNQLMDSVSAFAHRQPLAFLGCGILGGLILSRLFSASDRS